ncbi:MAG: aldo/keto reductase [Deltaproteobacteria bacterium]|nr:aldo/keto reductase [Deltaproteobacteria bacterium]
MTLLSPTITLRSGTEIPRIGLGVFRASPEDTRSAVLDALRIGYRHIDTARVYQNEDAVGAAIRESGVPRSEVFVTTKLWNDDQGYDRTMRAFNASLLRMGFDYVDLYLLHWPVPGRRLDSWRALEEIHASGRAKAIGISNFQDRHVEELLSHCKIIPHVNQMEISPFLQQRAVRAVCQRAEIAVEAYSPLTKGYRLGHAAITKVASRLQKSPAQVLVRWGLEQGLVVLPKSTKAERIKENAAVFDFELDADSRSELDALEEGLVTGWDSRPVP